MTGRRVWVHAVVVLWCEFPAEVVEGDRLVFLAGDRAAAWLEERPQQLLPARIATLAGAVAALPTAA